LEVVRSRGIGLGIGGLERGGRRDIRISVNEKSNMSYFRITLIRSAIGLPRRSTDVLKALGLKKDLIFGCCSLDGMVWRLSGVAESDSE
jgi:hypothetical protein